MTSRALPSARARTMPTEAPSKIVRKRLSASTCSRLAWNSAAWLIAAEITTDDSSSVRTSSSSKAFGRCATARAGCRPARPRAAAAPRPSSGRRWLRTRAGFTRGSSRASWQISERRSRMARPPRLWSRLSTSPTGWSGEPREAPKRSSPSLSSATVGAVGAGQLHGALAEQPHHRLEVEVGGGHVALGRDDRVQPIRVIASATIAEMPAVAPRLVEQRRSRSRADCVVRRRAHPTSCSGPSYPSERASALEAIWRRPSCIPQVGVLARSGRGRRAAAVPSRDCVHASYRARQGELTAPSRGKYRPIGARSELEEA